MANADDIRTDGDGFPSIRGIKDGIDGLKALTPKIEAMAERLDGLIADAQDQTESIHWALGKLDGMAGDLYRAAAAGEAWDVSRLADILKDCEHLCRDLEPSAWSVAGEYTMKFLNPDRPGFSLNASDDPVAGKMATALEAYTVVSNLKVLLADGIPEETVTKAIRTLDEATDFVTLCLEARACLDRLSSSDVQVLPMDIEADLHHDLMCEEETLHGHSRLYGREQGDSERHGMMPAIEESAVLLALGRLATTAAALAYVAHVTGEIPTEVGFLPSEDPIFPALPVELVVQAIEKSLPRAQALLLAIEAKQAMDVPEVLPRIAEKLNAYVGAPDPVNGVGDHDKANDAPLSVHVVHFGGTRTDFSLIEYLSNIKPEFHSLREMFEAVEAHVPVSIDNLAEFARPNYPTVDMGQGSVWCEAGAHVGDGYTAGAIVLEDGRFSAKPWHEACGVAFESATDRVSDVLPVAGGSAADMSFRDAQRICFNTENQKMVAVVEGGDCLMVHRGSGNDFPVYRKESLRDALAERYVVVLDAMVGEMHRSVSAGERWDAAALTDILEGYEKVCREVGAPADENAGQYALKFLHPNGSDDPVAARMVSAVHACQDLRNIASGEMECNANEVADALNTLRYAGQNDILTLTEDLPALGAAGLAFWKTVDPFLDERTKEDCLACDERGRLVLEVAGSFRALDFTSCLVEVAPEEVGLTRGEMTRLRDEMDVEAVSSSGMALVAERGNSGRIEGWTVKDILEMKAELAPRRGNAAARCIAEAVRESVRSAPAPAREAETGRRSGGLKL
ncbi:hypothetical protein [Azospirillum sp. TSO5]|uniref:hypothetical protein n=1 Tax=Azospirillum sp. TSO5 TaxID=716760 RepID=UPI000D61AC37|nr:hypothetical protein [Azospirillum sp. TSO5]PWC92877.1 hypothetical protein TSO5_15715 [Azospirillum sp. TSO5]